MLFGNLAERHFEPVIFRDSRLFRKIPYFWGASFGLFCYHLLAIIDVLIAQYASPLASISEKTVRMARKPKPENRAMGQVLAQYRERHGEIQQQLADALGIARVTVGHMKPACPLCQCTFEKQSRNGTAYLKTSSD